MKSAILEISDRNGNILANYLKFGNSGFNMAIGYGVGSLDIELPFKFDNYPTDIIKHANYVKIKVAGKNAPGGVTVYSGFISGIDSDIERGANIKITCDGHASKWQYTPLRQVSSPLRTDYNMAFNDQGLQLRILIDNYKTREPLSPLQVSIQTLPNTGASRTYFFDSKTSKYAIDAVAETLPSSSYLYIDPSDDFVYRRSINAAADHYLVLGRDIGSVKISSDVTKVVNQLLFWNGLAAADPQLVQKKFDDVPSQNLNGIFGDVKRDERYKASAGTANDYATRLIANNKDPKPNITINVIDNNFSKLYGYDIESIKPGQTVKILNIEAGTPVSGILLVTEIKYKYSSVDLVCDNKDSYISQLFFDLKQKELQNDFNSTSSRTFTT